MRLVESVAAEVLDQVEDLEGLFLVESPLDGALHELAAALGDDVGLLLGDRLDRGVGLGELDASQPVEDPHHLFLVHHHPVSLLEHLLEHGVDVAGLLPPVLDVDVLVDHAAVERARPVEGVGGDDVGEPVGLHLHQQIANSRALELEDPLGFTALEQLERLAVVEGKPIEVEGGVGVALVDDPHRRFQGGEVAQTEEVHLEKAGLLDVSHVPLGADDLVLVSPANDLERNQGLERLIGDHHARGVRAGVPRRAFEPPGKPDQAIDLGVLLDHRPQGRLFLEGLVDRDVQPGRDQLVDLLDPRQRNVQHPAHVLDGRLGLHRAERADLGHVRVAVLLADILDDLVPPFLAEVDIDVGGLGAIGVEEPLEQEVVLERADVAQVKHVAHQRATGRPAPRRGCRVRGHSGRNPRRSGNTRRTPSA